MSVLEGQISQLLGPTVIELEEAWTMYDWFKLVDPPAASVTKFAKYTFAIIVANVYTF